MKGRIGATSNVLKFNKVPSKTEGEDDMLDQAHNPNKFSRLSCQISVTDEIDGLVVDLPEKQ